MNQAVGAEQSGDEWIWALGDHRFSGPRDLPRMPAGNHWS